LYILIDFSIFGDHPLIILICLRQCPLTGSAGTRIALTLSTETIAGTYFQ
jgi:hypothetical protein